jgi:tryptophan dimethylallyltransferase
MPRTDPSRPCSVRDVRAQPAPGVAVPDATPRHLASSQITALAEAIGQPQLTAAALAAINALMAQWADVPFAQLPYPSTLTIDGSPFELSAAFGSAAAVRGLVAPPAADPQEMWDRALEINEQLAVLPLADMRWFDAIAPEFEPRGSLARWSVWHGFEVTDSIGAFKCFLNPQIAGPSAAEEVVRAGLQRLGLNDAAAFVRATVRSDPAIELAYLCVDLIGEVARVKVYFEHTGADVAALERILSHGPHYEPGLARRVQAALDPAAERYSRQRPVCSVAFTARDARPEAVTLQWPVWPHVIDDEVGLRRCRELFGPHAGHLLSRAVDVTRRRPLDAGVGLIQWISARRTPRGDRYVAYLAAEAFGGIPARKPEASPSA